MNDPRNRPVTFPCGDCGCGRGSHTYTTAGLGRCLSHKCQVSELTVGGGCKKFVPSEEVPK